MGTWELTDPPPNRVPITNKWVFIKKFSKDSKLQKYKVRLVARGFTQRLGMDYKTFSPVIHLETICTILVQAVKKDWEIQQMDVKGAYLNEILKEEIYMKQPKGYDDETGHLRMSANQNFIRIETIWLQMEQRAEWTARK